MNTFSRPQITLLIGVFLFGLGCSEPAHDGASIVVEDSSGVRIVTNDLTQLNAQCPVSPEPVLSIGVQDGEEPYLLYRVMGTTRLSDGGVALVNQGSNEVRFYDSNGTFRKSVGGQGEGPREFKSAFYIFRPNDREVWVSDSYPWSLKIYSESGEFLRSINPPSEHSWEPHFTGILEDERMILGQSSSSRDPEFTVQPVQYSLHSREGELTDSLFTLSNGKWGEMGEGSSLLTLFRLLESFAHESVSKSKLYSGQGQKPEINVYGFDSGVNLELIVRWKGQDQRVTPEAIANERDKIRDQYKNQSEVFFRDYLPLLVSQERPIAEVLPAFTDIEAGRDGAIWAKLFSQKWESGMSDWVRFTEEGKMACTAQIPSSLRFIEFGSNYVLGTIRDDIGVERVQVFSIGTPEEAL